MANYQSQIPDVIKQLKQNAARLSLRTAYEGQADIWEDMGKGKSGRVYGSHQASAPGESPAIDTFAYGQSIKVISDSDGFATIGTDSELGPWLEYGTSKMAPRPHFAPAFAKMAESFKKGLDELMRGQNITATAPAPPQGIRGKIKSAISRVKGFFKRK